MTGQQAATKNIDSHVVPNKCFVWYESKDNWTKIKGTGCAHWVAHEKGIKKGSSICLEGYTYRVSNLLIGKKQINISQIKVGDIYVNANRKG